MGVAVTLAVATSASAGDVARGPYVGAFETGHPVHLQLRVDALYASFAPGVGASARLAAQTRIWNVARATGTLDAGLMLRYTWGGQALYPWMGNQPGRETSGSDQNVLTALTVGHTFHLGPARRSSLGVHVFAGLNVQRSHWDVAFPAEGLSEGKTTVFVAFAWGPEVDYHYRFSRNVGFDVVIGGVSPTQPAIAGNLLHVGAGLTFYLR